MRVQQFWSSKVYKYCQIVNYMLNIGLIQEIHSHHCKLKIKTIIIGCIMCYWKKQKKNSGLLEQKKWLQQQNQPTVKNRFFSL